jgi:ABC-2 type transport system permease protein
MNRLLVAELNRLRSRRLTWVALVLVLLTIVLLQLAVFFSVRPLTPAELAEGKVQFAQAQKEYQDNRADYEQQAKDCVDQGNPPQDCGPYVPKPEDYASRYVTSFPEITAVVVTVTVFVSTLAFMFLGASFIGAEYSSGALANWLSFIPERGKVFASKLVALVVTAAVATWLLSALGVGLAALVSNAVGAKVSGLGDLFEMVTRGSAVGVIGAVVGFALALVTRHTIAAAGTVLGYLLLAFVLSAFTQSIAALQGLIPWLPENNVLAFLDHGYTYQTYVNTITDQGTEQTSVEHTLTFAHSSIYWAVIMVVLVVGTLLLFRRRDVN